ncbi:ranaspumin-like isoform X1 [Aquarana catesbeiana]|uniref:ranaspumin-like isoform X1 n=1 Tax=Aquarana catesbeiana TaxID=8400 RepID=UPI003CCA0108
MKILLFALFGLSFYQANGDDGFSTPSTPESEEHTCTTSPVPYADSVNCLAQAMKESVELFKDIGVFICKYQACKKGNNCNDESFKKTLTTFIYVAKCTGCQADKYFKTGNTFEKLLTEISGSRFQVGEFVEKFLESLGIAKPLADTLCLVVGGILQSECVQNALGNLAPSVVQDLTVIYCKEGDSEKESAGKVADILKGTRCEVATVMGPEYELEDVLGLLGDTSKLVIAIVLNLTKQLSVVDNSLCTVLNGPLVVNNGNILEMK